MSARLVAATFGLLGTAVLAAGDLCNGPAAPGTGADLVTCCLGNPDGLDFKEYFTFEGNSVYAFGTTACNNGDTIIDWVNFGESAHLHPVIAENLYRLKDGRFEQLGMSWLKHGFCAGDAAGCGACIPDLVCGTLAIGCSDTYTAQTNGDVPTLLGPRYQANPATAEYVLPHATPSGVVAGRLRVAFEDLDPALNEGAAYFGEAQYLTPDEAGGTNRHNNSAWREVQVGDFVFTLYDLSFTGPVHTSEPAIQAWQDADPAVLLDEVDVPGDGRFILGSRAAANGDGTWSYEYALLNMNSDRAARQFQVPAAGAIVTNTGFHDVDYHSGDGVGGVDTDGTDWPATVLSAGVSFETETEAENPNANALRWGTLYNFRFDADRPPSTVTASIGLFRAGAPSTITAQAAGPDPCPWDLDGNGQVNVTDLLALLAAWGTDPGAPPDFDGNGSVDVTDLLAFLGRWGPCPSP